MRATSCRPPVSNKHSSTLSACSENKPKLTPSPSQVAPSGYGLPRQTARLSMKLALPVNSVRTVLYESDRCSELPSRRRRLSLNEDELPCYEMPGVAGPGWGNIISQRRAPRPISTCLAQL